MAVNGSHAGKGVLIFAGECIILYSDNVTMEFNGSIPPEMKGAKTGRLYLTSHRIIFNNKNPKDNLQSFASPFFCLKQVELEQPVFGANYIKGIVKAQDNGGFRGEVKFKLIFKHGGAIEYGQALLKVASMATQHINPTWREAPPPYTPPAGPWVSAAPPAYAPPQAGYYGWVPPTATFPDRPPRQGTMVTNENNPTTRNIDRDKVVCMIDSELTRFRNGGLMPEVNGEFYPSQSHGGPSLGGNMPPPVASR